MKENSESSINDYFHYWFRLPGETLKSCGIETITLHPDESISDCGIKCLFSATKCDFFYYEFPKCYLASYNCTFGLNMPVPSEFKTYHNLEYYESTIWENRFQKFGSKKSEVNDWNQWIFKVDKTYNNVKRCTFLCYMDSKCDYFVLDNNCYFGSSTFFGPPISIENMTNEVTSVHLKVDRDCLFFLFLTLKETFRNTYLDNLSEYNFSVNVC